MGAGGALTAPEPLTPLPAQDQVHSQGSSQPCLLTWLWLPLGQWGHAALGMSRRAGAVSAQQQHPPAGLREGAGEHGPPTSSPASHLGGPWPGIPSRLPVPLAQGRESRCRARLTYHGHGGTGQRLESDLTQSQGHSCLRGPGFSVPHPSGTSLGRDRGQRVPWAAPGMDRDPSRQRQPDPRCTLSPCGWQS